MRSYFRQVCFSIFIVWSLVSASGAVLAGAFTIPSGAGLSLGNAKLVNTGGTLIVGGTVSAGTNEIITDHLTVANGGVLNGGSATLVVCGNWSNDGTFNAESSSVYIDDSCRSLSEIGGENTFYNLTLESRTGKTVQLVANSAQTVNGALVLKGVEAALLTLRSSIGGQIAQLIALGSGSGEFIDVDEIDSSAGNPISVDAFSIVGPSANGFLATMAPVLQIPAVPLAGLLLLFTAMVAIAMMLRSTRRRIVARYLPAEDKRKRPF